MNLRSSFSFLLGIGLLCASLAAQTVTASGSVTVASPHSKGKPDNSGVVIWLQRVFGGERPAPSKHTILQKDKRFDPHILVVPTGSSVAFPNLDPFFHNVFSMFDGKRFDLGLYEARTSRSTTFTKPGVCYIFCNIHPEMSAVVVVLDTPHYAVTGPSGDFSIPGVAPGRFEVFVWHERAQLERAGEYPREITIPAQNVSLGGIHLVDSGKLTIQHKNKYGRDYDLSTAQPGYK